MSGRKPFKENRLEWVRVAFSSPLELGLTLQRFTPFRVEGEPAGYALEVAQICRQHRIAERERGRTDQEIAKGITTPRVCCSASSLPASLAMSVVRG